MNPRKSAHHASLLLIMLATTLILLGNAFAVSPERVVYSFGQSVATEPIAPLVSDAAGNFYGTAPGSACPPSCGAVFELSPSGGSLRYTTLHVFKSRNGDGTSPYGALLRDAAGNLFGTTRIGGSSGQGIVFELSPSPTGWTYSVLYNFQGQPNDGAQPRGSLAMDVAGNLYGTTFNGGTFGTGTAFQLSPSPSGWTESVIHIFGGPTGDGAYPEAGMVLDAAGNLYGTTEGGGQTQCYIGCGTVFELSQSGGSWTETQLYLFSGYPNDGENPTAALVFDTAGNIFGTTYNGGSSKQCNPGQGCGLVFELSPAGGTWVEKQIHVFNRNPDGAYPNYLTFDGAGNLFGTTYAGGTGTGVGCFESSYHCGTVYELSPSGGSWIGTVLHNFQSNVGSTDGGNPLGGVIFGIEGNLYGTTETGGVHSGEGTVFTVKP